MRNSASNRTRPCLHNPASVAGKTLYVAATFALIALFLIDAFSVGTHPDLSGIQYARGLHHFSNPDQYGFLADSLLHGRLDLDLPIPDELRELENPYDYGAREEIGSEDVPIFWDHAFYDGKYYCYFGVIPAVLFFVPYQLATGAMLGTPAAIRFIGVLAIIAASLLVYRFARTFFRESATTASLVLALCAVFFGNGYIYLGFAARFYTVPILSSLLFTALGLWFWLGSYSNFGDGGPGGSAAKLSIPHLAAGSTCMALNLGCRPQFILACLLAFPLFRRAIVEERLLFSREGVGGTVAALAPFAVVFAPLLAYNYARFGSPLDFGSSYNLTSFDMTTYYQSIRLTGILIIAYLFVPAIMKTDFPFLGERDIEHLEIGWAPHDTFFGGYFFLKPLMLVSLLFPAFHSNLRRKGLLGFTIICTALAVFVLIADTRIGGVTARYFSDFGFYIGLVACCVLFSFQDAASGKNPTLYHMGIALAVIALIVTFAFSQLELFPAERFNSIYSLNPELFAAFDALF